MDFDFAFVWVVFKKETTQKKILFIINYIDTGF